MPIIWSHPGVIEDIVFRRIKMISTHTAIAVKSLPSYRGVVRNVLWEDIEIVNVSGSAIMISMFSQNDLTAMPGDLTASDLTATAGDDQNHPALMQLQNITIRNVVVTGAQQAGKIECGNGTHACAGITMENVTMREFGRPWECVGEVRDPKPHLESNQNLTNTSPKPHSILSR